MQSIAGPGGLDLYAAVGLPEDLYGKCRAYSQDRVFRIFAV